jgi:hypothetical protein
MGVYAANGIYNDEFEIPWCKIGKTINSAFGRLRYSQTFSSYHYEELDCFEYELDAIEHLSHAIAAQRFGRAPRTYISRKNEWERKYEGYTETFLCDKDDGFIIICEAGEWVNKALKSSA